MRKNASKKSKKPTKKSKAVVSPAHRGVSHIRRDARHPEEVFVSLRSASSIVRMPRDQLRQRLRDADIGPAGRRGQSPVWSMTDIWDVVGPNAFRAAAVDAMGPTDRRAHYGSERLKLALNRKAAGLVRAEDAAAAKRRVAKVLHACIDEATAGLVRLGASAQMVAAAEQHFSSVRAALLEFGGADT